MANEDIVLEIIAQTLGRKSVLREDTPFVKEVKSEGIFDILVRDLKLFDNYYDRRVVPLPDHILSKVRREHRLENNINTRWRN